MTCICIDGERDPHCPDHGHEDVRSGAYLESEATRRAVDLEILASVGGQP